MMIILLQQIKTVPYRSVSDPSDVYTMNHLIVRDVREGRWAEFEISDEEFKCFIFAKRVLSEYLEIETLFDALMEEYWQYKNSVDYWRLRSVSRSQDYKSNYEIRNNLNRITINILNLSKLYLDKHYHQSDGRCYAYNVTKIEKDKQIISEHKTKLHKENLNYAIGCKLRNKAQHHSLPVSTIVTGIQNRVGQKSQITFKIQLDRDYLIGIGISKLRLADVEHVNLTDVLDGYIYAISEMHSLNRKIVSAEIENQKDKIRSITNPRASSTEYSKFVTEIENENGETYTSDLDWFLVVDHLIEKHRRPINYQRFMFSEHWPEQE